MQQCFGPNELLEDVFQRDLCVGCGMCVDVCPYFKNYMGKTTQAFKCDQQKNRRCGHPVPDHRCGENAPQPTRKRGFR